MIELECDLWSEPADIKCITTNGFVKNNGSGVMGAGIARQAQGFFPNMPKVLGKHLRARGNHVGLLGLAEDTIYVSFPVKENFFDDADLSLIERSAHELEVVATVLSAQKILLPRPGCGNGHLTWELVRPVIEPILDDRFVAVWRPFA